MFFGGNPMTDLLSPLGFKSGREMKNRFMLAPLTNQQSHPDGILSEEEFTWLTKRAEGGFGLTMTCAAHVQANGQGFPGQLGVFGDQHLPGLTRLAEHIKRHNSLAICQLHHAGIRSPAALIGEAPVGASDDEKTGGRALSLEEVHQLRDDFVAAAMRCEQAGFDGVELHGAHSYIICQFLSEETNQRTDEYGGSVENRNRLLLEIIDGVRAACGKNFMLGVRLSPERFGLKLAETTALAEQLMVAGKIDFLDMSLWDVFKEPEEEAFKGRSLMSYFAELERGDVRLGVAGKIRTPAEAETAMAAGVDWIMLGRAAILHHNFPDLYAADKGFKPIENPVSRQHLAAEGLSENFISYMGNWPGFVAEEAVEG
tara:strand:- start:30041 stop:31153 length:1113 start_codon:yes stop_codon:yes gene_type:complete